MRLRLIAFVLVAGVLGVGCTTALVATGAAAGLAVVAVKPREPVWDSGTFSAVLHRAALPPTGQGNAALSPYSAGVVLALAYTGATNETARAMATALCLDDRGADVAQVFQRIGRVLDTAGGEGGVVLTRGISIWPRDGLTLNPYFVQTAHAGFHSDVIPVAMDETGRLRINAHVREQTRGRIEAMLPPPIPDDTSLILINTLFFKGAWARPFSSAKTAPGAFQAPDGEMTVSFMHDINAFRHADCGAFSALYLPYRGERVEMVVLLPESADGVDGLTRAYGPDLLRAADRAASEKQVRVALPAFSISSMLELGDALVEMGMGPAFSGRASFSGITTDVPLRISRVLQQVRVDVDEDGTEAAAATAVMMARLAMLPRPSQAAFIADRPFLFVIRETTSGVVLFSGRVERPARAPEGGDGR